MIRQLQGYEISAAAWESEILPRRIARYTPELLDQLCLSGEVMWGRLSPHPAFDSRRTAPSAPDTRGSAFAVSSPGRRMVDGCPRRTVCPLSPTQLARSSRRWKSAAHPSLPSWCGQRVDLPSEVEDGLWELVAAGLVTADGFENLRSLVDPKRRRGEGRGRLARPRHAAGRWALIEHERRWARSAPSRSRGSCCCAGA